MDKQLEQAKQEHAKSRDNLTRAQQNLIQLIDEIIEAFDKAENNDRTRHQS